MNGKIILNGSGQGTRRFYLNEKSERVWIDMPSVEWQNHECKFEWRIIMNEYTINEFIEKVYEIAFGDDAINRGFTRTDVIDQLQELSDHYPENHHE
mgnify:CR=1 FL=1